jgi:aminopeptidase N
MCHREPSLRDDRLIPRRISYREPVRVSVGAVLFACLIAASPVTRRDQVARAAAARGTPSAIAARQPSIGWPVPVAPSSSALPPSDLLTLANPQRAAISRHEIAVRVDPATHAIAAVDRILVSRDPGTTASEPISFLLWDSLRVESVRGPGDAPLRFEVRDRMNPRSFWKRPPYDRLEDFSRTRQVDVFLDGSERSAWPDSFRLTVRYAGTVMDSLRPPKAAYARSFEETAGLIEERGVYLCGTSFWVPSRPEEVFTFRCEAEVPEGWRAVSQGALEGSGPAPVVHVRTAAGTREEKTGEGGNAPPRPWIRDIWDCPQPMEEIYLVAGPYALHQRDHRGTAVMTYTYADSDSALFTRYLDGTGRYLDLYEERIGRYPFPKFALVENFWQTGYGMPSFTLLGNRVIRLPFILDTSYGHEILHNWWGNGVFVDAATGNWSEGLTTYGADYFYKERESAEAGRDYRRNALVSYLDYVSGSADIPLSAFTGRSNAATQAIGYSKSMMVIHQLRRSAGAERFQAALRDFFQKNLWRRASWSDLLESFRTAAGIEPGSFRAQWIERSGLPSLGVRGVRVDKAGKVFRVRATLTQSVPKPPAPGGGTSASGAAGTTAPKEVLDVPPYALTVPVRVSFAGGDSTWQVPMAAGTREWSALVPGRPTQLAIDPDFDMARRIDRREIPPSLSRTLGADTVSVVIASGLAPEVEAACRALAAEWAKGQALSIREEATLEKGWTPPSAAWYLGLGPAARTLVAGLPEVRLLDHDGPKIGHGTTGGAARGNVGNDLPSWTIAGNVCPDTCSVVLAGDYPGGGEASWALIAPADPAGVAAVGTKVPHYGKYGYLVFRGANVVQKGSWAETPSPLVVDLAKEEK